MKQKILAAKIALVMTITTTSLSMPVNAGGIPVIDGTNLTQNMMTALESVAQTIKQVEEYRTQLQQYSDQIQNTIAPTTYVWDQAQSTINGLMSAVDTLNYYKNQVGSLDSYLGKFQDVSYYRGSPCFSSVGCSDAERAVMQQNRIIASQSQKKANDALFHGLDLQQDALKADARRLEQLQSAAQSATGRMEAIQYANQLASQQSNQLLQIRGLLIAQQNAMTTRNQVLADREAQEEASAEQLRMGVFHASPVRYW
jgi:P-type conjugative transfer protein TrbJ